MSQKAWLKLVVCLTPNSTTTLEKLKLIRRKQPHLRVKQLVSLDLVLCFWSSIFWPLIKKFDLKFCVKFSFPYYLISSLLFKKLKSLHKSNALFYLSSG